MLPCLQWPSSISGTAELLDGCATDNADVIDGHNGSHPVVKFSRMLASICRHDKDFRWDDDSFVSLEEMLTKKDDHAYTW